MEFLVRPAVENGDIGAIVHQALQFLRRNIWRSGFVFDHFGERLARHVNAAIDRKPSRFPATDAAIQHRE